MARKPAPFNLTVNDQLELESWLRTSTLSQNLVQRARIILALNAGELPKAVAERLETSTPTVFKWRNRYIEQGLSGLQDAPRPGQPRKLDRKKVKSILDYTVKKRPKESMGALHNATAPKSFSIFCGRLIEKHRKSRTFI